MAIDRSKFIRTSASQLQQDDKDLNKTLGRKERGNNKGHTLDDGHNLFRLYPAHPVEMGGGRSFVEPFVQTFLPAMVQDKDKDGNVKKDNQGKPVMKLGVRPVWNTKAHGNKKKDLVEEFIILAGKTANAMGLKGDSYKEYMKPIYGAYSKDPNKNIQGVNYPLLWVVYADKYPGANSASVPSLDEFRLKKSVKDRLNSIAAMETSNDPLGTDPFTDLEEGKAVKIFYNKEAEKASDYYTTELDNSTVTEVINGKQYKLPKTYPLTDDQLENFLKLEPLAVKYGEKLATRKNFEAQLAGLELVDNKYQMGIFGLQEWGDIVIEIDSYYPEVDAPIGTPTEAVSDVVEDVVEDDTDEFELMNRTELTAYAKSNKTGILVRPALDDEGLRQKLRAWKENLTTDAPGALLPNEEGYKEEEVVALVSKLSVVKEETKEEFLAELNKAVVQVVSPADAVELKTTPVNTDAKSRLAALRAKTNKAAVTA
jgi:hypothetical protein